VTGTVAGNLAPYTVKSGAVLYDNSDSRLNVARPVSILFSIPSWPMPISADRLSGERTQPSYTGLLHESAGRGFQFHQYAECRALVCREPCYNINQDAANPVDSACLTLAARYGVSIKTYQWMQIGDTSDESNISDVLYDPGLLSPVFVTWATRIRIR